MFTNLITDDTNCSSFESEMIVDKSKEVFAIGDYAREHPATGPDDMDRARYK